MNPMLDGIFDILQCGKAAFAILRTVAAWSKETFARRGNRKEKRRKKAEKQYLRMLRRARHKQQRKTAWKWTKRTGRVARAIGRKYF